jgi:hypothetical protein
LYGFDNALHLLALPPEDSAISFPPYFPDGEYDQRSETILNEWRQLIHYVIEPFTDIICIHPTDRIQLWSSRPLANSVPNASDDRAFNPQVVCNF